MIMPLSDPAMAVPTPSDPLAGERGLTLTELTIVGVLATIVMLALTTFYFNSQQVWIAGSTQALAQRDGTLLVEELRRRVHEAQVASVDTTDAAHHQLSLMYAGPTPPVDFRWDSSDQRVHLLVNGIDKGPVVDTPVSRMQFTTQGAAMVDLTLLELRTANGDSVRTASRFALLGQ